MEPIGSHWNPMEVNESQLKPMEPKGTQKEPKWKPVEIRGTQLNPTELNGSQWKPIDLTSQRKLNLRSSTNYTHSAVCHV